MPETMFDTPVPAVEAVGRELDLHTKIAVQDDRMFVGRSQDCTAIAEYAQARQREGHHGDKEMKFAASLPYVIVEKYCNEKRITFAEFMGNREHIKRICNDPDNAAFRIWPGKL